MSATRISKLLSLVLRHDPAKFGITLDDAGWTDVDALLAACATHGVALTRPELAALVAASDKQRFALSDDGARIRANQGHSVDVELGLEPLAPPARLFHGTVPRFLSAIRAGGLDKGARHHVHLSAELETATRVGGRRGSPVIVTVRAAEMAAAGHLFYRSTNGVWLADHVPAEFLDLPELDAADDRAPRVPPTSRDRGGARGAKAAIAQATLAACEAGRYVNAHGHEVALTDAITAARAGTRLYELSRYASPTASPRHDRMTLRVDAASTIEAIRQAAPRARHLACLNFASAKNPGGGFLGGAQAQEESLARSSALYGCQLEVPAHYARNRAHRSAIYLDLAIWSPHVPVFRDDEGGWLDAPAPCSMITCAAPNAGALRQHGRYDAAEVEAALRRRAAFVLAIARDHEVDILILGAWGAGVFGNDPAMVAAVFAQLLRTDFDRAFAEVVFAVIGGPGHANHDAFVAVLGQ